MSLPKKILIVRFSSIGDIILTTPVVRCLKQQLPAGTQIHYLTKPAFKNILASNPYIDGVHTLQNSLSATAKALAVLKFDYLLDLHNNRRTWLLKMLLGIPSSSFGKLNLEKWLLTALKINRLPAVHIVQRYMAPAVRNLGISDDGLGLDYFIPANETVNINEDFLPLTKNGNSPENSSFIAIAVGAAHVTKRVPPEKLIEICKKIHDPIILLGGKEDIATGAFIAQNAGPHVRSLCGQLTLNGSASVLKQARKVITPDTGLMHIAAAFNKPIAVVWGNTVPAFGMYPYCVAEWQSFEVTNLSCRPCSKIGYNKCPKGHFNCMNLMAVDAIANWANQTV